MVEYLHSLAPFQKILLQIVDLTIINIELCLQYVVRLFLRLGSGLFKISHISHLIEGQPSQSKRFTKYTPIFFNICKS